MNSICKCALPAVILLGSFAHADDDVAEAVLDEDYTTGGVPAVTGVGAGVAGEAYGFGDQVGTAQGDILEGIGRKAEGVGRGMYFRSLSATQFQEAIDERLDNRRERVETYFELQDLNEREREEDELDVSIEERREIQKNATPDRLNEEQLDPQTGEIKWVGPLSADALKPYRKPIEDSFAVRASPGEEYTARHYFRVQRMIDLMREALESVKDRMDSREFVYMDKYLDQISYEAKFNAAGERVDY